MVLIQKDAGESTNLLNRVAARFAPFTFHIRPSLATGLHAPDSVRQEPNVSHWPSDLRHFMILILIIILCLLLLLALLCIVGTILLWKKHPEAGLAVLAVYVALIGFFVVYGNIERRSAVGHIVRWCEGEDGAHQDANDLAEDAKRVVNPSELQQWAMAILRQPNATNYPDGMLPRDKVLPSIRNLQSGGESFEDAEVHLDTSKSPENRSIWIVWGGGFGHWGITVGSPAFKVTDRYDDNYYVEWQPGIYFWAETH
jgi:hypothetical protein